MKHKIFMLICIFAAMATIPVVCLNFEAKTKKENTSDDISDIVCKTACAYCNNEFCDEAIEAITEVIVTNIKSGYSYESKDISDKELFKRIKALYNSKSELYINNSIKFIPLSVCSSGSTQKSKKYDYISPVASPWDCFSNNYSKNNSCEGVSADGINYLCKNGFSKKDALKWYIPNLTD